MYMIKMLAITYVEGGLGMNALTCGGSSNDVRFFLAASRRILYRNGCDSAVAGHVTAQAWADGFGDGLRMTPFEYFDETMPTMPSAPASAFHSVNYRRRPDVGSIVHIHSRYTAMHVRTDREVRVYNVNACVFQDEQAHYIDDGTVPSVDGERMADCLGDKSVLLMRTTTRWSSRTRWRTRRCWR
jgi:hypothetical protein